MGYLIYILIGWGITDFLVNGSILDRVRVYFLVKVPVLAELLTCIRCSGFWVGSLMGLVCLSGVMKSPFLDFHPLVQVISSGFLIGGSSVIINSLMIYFLSPRYLIHPNRSQEDNHQNNLEITKDQSEDEENKH